MSKKYAIIVAGGSGSRMKSDLPKQFIKIGDKPIMAHTISQFQKADCQVIVVLPASHFKTFKDLVLSHCHSTEMILVEGGKTRFESVKNGLACIHEECLIAIHDAVRPFIPTSIIDESFDTAVRSGTAVVSVPLKDSIRLYKEGHNEAVNRSDYRIIQTPQTFKSSLLFSAYKQEYKDFFTDDASVVESAGHTIHLIEGDYKKY